MCYAPNRGGVTSASSHMTTHGNSGVTLKSHLARIWHGKLRLPQTALTRSKTSSGRQDVKVFASDRSPRAAFHRRVSDPIVRLPNMSSRTRSRFGNLDERLRKPTTPFCLVDNQHPGLIIEWVLREE